MSKPENKAADPTGGEEERPQQGGPKQSPPKDAVTQPDADAPDESGSGIDEDPLELMRGERDRLQNQLQRTLADLQNFRKRRVQELADARKLMVEVLCTELLPVLDNFHLATQVGEQTGEDAVESIREGLLMVRGLLEAVFERHGVIEIAVENEKFDPAVHEAVGIDPDPDAAEGIVTQVLQRGYTLDGKVLRPTRVMVGGNRAQGEASGKTEVAGGDEDN